MRCSNRRTPRISVSITTCALKRVGGTDLCPSLGIPHMPMIAQASTMDPTCVKSRAPSGTQMYQELHLGLHRPMVAQPCRMHPNCAHPAMCKLGAAYGSACMPRAVRAKGSVPMIAAPRAAHAQVRTGTQGSMLKCACPHDCGSKGLHAP